MLLSNFKIDKSVRNFETCPNKSLTNECTIIPSYRYLIIMQQNNNITLNKVINLIKKSINDNCLNSVITISMYNL